MAVKTVTFHDTLVLPHVVPYIRSHCYSFFGRGLDVADLSSVQLCLSL